MSVILQVEPGFKLRPYGIRSGAGKRAYDLDPRNLLAGVQILGQ
jgi:hypothetical protein